jgi:HTH-type transcriptional regulator / antitoxin HigA
MNNLQPIRTKEDHKVALQEIERLFDAPQGTPEFDRLEILVTLVEAYENIHEPILPPDPIEAILYYLESRGLTTQHLEIAIGSQDKVTEILDRQTPLTIRNSSTNSDPALRINSLKKKPIDEFTRHVRPIDQK